MKERPILFSGPMVLAILEGRKTQTRRVCKARDEIKVHPNGQVLAHGGFLPELVCPYGQPGDRLWVRETFRIRGGDEYAYQKHQGSVVYREGCELIDSGPWKPSIFMPRWASRITLEIEAVRVERVQDITEEDALAEGCTRDFGPDGSTHWGAGLVEAKTNYQVLWESINAKRGFGWGKNPFVWVIQFKRITP